MKKTFILVASVAMLAVLIGCSGVFEGRANRLIDGGPIAMTLGGPSAGDPEGKYNQTYHYGNTAEYKYYDRCFDISPSYSPGTCIELSVEGNHGTIIPTPVGPFYYSVELYPAPDPASGNSYRLALKYMNELSIGQGLQPVYSYEGEFNPDKWPALFDYSKVTLNRDRNGYRFPSLPETTSINAYTSKRVLIWRENYPGEWSYVWGPSGNQRILYASNVNYADGFGCWLLICRNYLD